MRRTSTMMARSAQFYVNRRLEKIAAVTRRGEAEYCQDTKISCRRDDGTTAALARLRQEVRRYYCEPMGAWREARRDASTMPTQTMLQIPVQPAEGLGLVGWSKTRKPQTPAPPRPPRALLATKSTSHVIVRARLRTKDTYDTICTTS